MLVVAGRSDLQRCIFTKPLTKSDEKAKPQQTLLTLLVECLGGRVPLSYFPQLVSRALQVEPSLEECVIQARDASGTMLSSSVAPTRVRLRVYTVHLSSDMEWTAITPFDSFPRQLYLADGLSACPFTRDNLARFELDVPPIDPPLILPNELSLATPELLVREHVALYMKIYKCLQSLVPGQVVAQVSMARSWPAVHSLRERVSELAEQAEEAFLEAMAESEECLQPADLSHYDGRANRYREEAGLLNLMEAAAGLQTIREEALVSVPGSSRYPCIPLYCAGDVFELILHEQKTIESRLAWGPYAHVQPGWLLCVRRNEASAVI